MACHPGVSETICFVLRSFWWPMLDKDTWEFVVACAVCAWGKALHQAEFMAFLPIWCPQFTSQAWKAFVKDLEAPVSWSSGYDPQSKRANQYLEPFTTMPPPTHVHGVKIFSGWSIPTTLSPVLPLDYLLLRHHWAINLYSHLRHVNSPSVAPEVCRSALECTQDSGQPLP